MDKPLPDASAQGRGIDDLSRGKEEKIAWATRAPHAKDGGRVWVKYTENSDTSMTLYLRHPVTGTWRSVAVS